MLASVEAFVHELRSFDASAEPAITDTFEDL